MENEIRPLAASSHAGGARHRVFIPFYSLGADEKLAVIAFHAVRNDLARASPGHTVSQTPWFLFCGSSSSRSAPGCFPPGHPLMMQKKVRVAYNLVLIVIAVSGYSMMLIVRACGEGLSS